MRQYLSICFFIGLACMYAGCEDSSDDPGGNGDPANLQVQVEVSDDGSGDVKVTATGDGVTTYELDPGDDSETLATPTGIFYHTYASTASYTIRIRAYGESGRYLEEEQNISVSVDDEEIPVYEGYELVWHDEFNTSSLSSFWNYETGGGGWGNNELQYYQKDNTEVTGGNLVITAREENIGGYAYTSSRLTTEGNYEFKYGRVDISAKLPEGQGLWPALWMLGANFSSVGWPACGEVDIMEMIGGSGRENTIHGTLHWQDPNGDPGNNYHAEYGDSYTASAPFSDAFHMYSIIWDATQIAWYVDGLKFHSQSITDPNKTEFQNAFFFIMNVAVGGNWPGRPDATTQFPQQMMVDYVRVYQKK